MKKIYTTFLFSILFANIFAQTNDGLHAHYKLNGNAYDSGPNGIHGILIGGQSAANFNNESGMALAFDGVDDFINLDNLCNNWHPEEITVEALFYPNLESDSTSGVIFAFNSFTGFPIWHNIFILYYSSQENYFVYFDPDSGNVFTASNYPPEQWYCVQLTIDKDLNGALKVNGEIALEFSASVLPKHGDRFSIGQEWDETTTSSNHFKGIIDEVKVFDKLPADNAPSLCDQITITELKDHDYSIKIYPTPTVDYLNIETKEINFSSYVIFNFTGKMIVQNEFEKLVNISSLPTGMYIIVLKTEDGQAISKKFYKSDLIEP